MDHEDMAWRHERRDADAYSAMLQPELVPGVSKVTGYIGSYLCRRDLAEEVEFTTVMLWESVEALVAFAGEDYERAVIPQERRKLLKRFDATSVHAEVVCTHGRTA